jgi:dTDP-L-rhamnose 4-epimerase
MRVLVTGGAGFIGSHIVDLLCDDGHDVVVLDNLLAHAHHCEPTYLNRAATYIWGDVRDPQVVLDALGGVDAVSHQSSMVGLGVALDDIVEYVEHNDRATAVLLQALGRARFAGRVVLASSMVVYGEGRYRCAVDGIVRPAPRPLSRLEAGAFEPLCPFCDRELLPEQIDEADPLDPRNVYAATKLHQEHLLSSYARVTGNPTVALRYHNVYGPRMPRDTPYAGVAAIFRSSLARGESPQVFEDGAQRRDFVHVHDVARANRCALLADDTVTGAFNVASGHPHTIGEMASVLADAADGPAPVTTGAFRAGDVRHVFASADRAQRELGFTAEVAFVDGIREFATAPLRD